VSMENRREERQQLQERGEAALMNALILDPRPPPGSITAYRFWHYPAFGVYHSWTIITNQNVPERIVRRVAWDRPHDMRRFVDPLEGVRQGFSAPPTLAMGDRVIMHETWEALFAEVAGASLPLFDFPERIGIDGESWGLAIPGYCEQALVQWWSDGPPAWRPFTTRVVAMLAQIDLLFDAA
jgi:hypothetical protein